MMLWLPRAEDSEAGMLLNTRMVSHVIVHTWPAGAVTCDVWMIGAKHGLSLDGLQAKTFLTYWREHL